MTGRGRPRKAKSPDAECIKRETRLDIEEEKQNEAKKKQKPKKGSQKNPNNSEEKLSLESAISEKTTNHSTEEINKQQCTPTDSTKAKTSAARTKLAEQPEMMKMKTTKDSPKTTRTKKCSGRAKSQEQLAEEVKPETAKGTRKTKTCVRNAKSPERFSEEMTRTQPETPKDTTENSVEITKAKACGAKQKSRVQFAEAATKMQLEQYLDKITKTESQTPTDTTKASEKTTKAKICAGNAKSPEESRKIPKMPPRKYDMAEENAAMDYILNDTLKKMTIKRNDRSKAAKVINAIEQNIMTHLRENTQTFKEVQEPLHTGSYYENVKICNPDEFDIMMPMSVERVNIEPFGDDGAFYSVALKRDKNPLKKFQENDILSASKMLSEFREEVKKCVKRFTEWKVERKKKGCPAVTLTTEVQSVPISLDIVLCLMVKSNWPSFTKDGLKIEGWLGTKVKLEYRRMPYYLVPKYEGSGALENDGVLTKDVWRVSFSHVEKNILNNHGSEKTCCEKGGERCCRKSCLKLLKYLLHLLKERDSSFDKFCSYHAKTTLLRACCLRTKDSDWRASDLSHCFQLLLKDFEDYLENGELKNFFIPSQNLLSGPGKKKCRSLSNTIREECQKGFPIFKQQL